MPQPPILLYLHGVGDGDPDDEWQAVLELALARLGYPDLSGITVVAPKYPNGLNGVDDEEPLPKVIVKAPRGDAAKEHRRDFERRRTAMEVRLGSDDPGDGWPALDHLAPAVTKLLGQANNYIKDRKIRAWVLDRIIKRLPPSGRLVVVGHSLGSVIAADLVRRLPTDLEVVGMVTIGSPLAHEALQVESLRELLAKPPANLAWWVNFRIAADPVPTGRGVSAVFPWVLDQRIQAPLRLNPVRAHDANTYLKSDTVPATIGFGLFGSLSKEIVLVEKGIDIPLDPAETFALLALRYAHLTMNELEGDTRHRYADALRQVQAATVEQIRDRNRNMNESRPMPAAIAALSVDLSDPTSLTPVPGMPGHLDVDEAAVLLVAIAESNVVRPYEIKVDREDRQKAMEQLTLEMKLGRQVGANVFEALDTARKVLRGPTNWVRWAALGLGSAAVVAATGGLALAAAPGVAGAAAITSALAAFGPGGMIGGLLTAGTLMSAGGGGVAIGLAAPGTTAEAVEAVVAAQLAAVVLRELQGLEQDPQISINLLEAETQVRRELTRLEPVSDESAPTVKELRRKLDAIERAVDYLRRHDLDPTRSKIVAGET